MSNYKIIQISASSRYALLDLKGLEANSKRELEAKGIRFLLDKLLPEQGVELAYYETGKPYLKNRKERMSISHSHNKVAVLIDEYRETGIDVELIRDKVLSVAHKYLSDEERRDLVADDVEKHLVYWAAKETLYKIYGRKKVDFKEHLFIEPFKYNAMVGGLITGHLLMDGVKKRYLLHYEKIEEYVLVYLIQ